MKGLARNIPTLPKSQYYNVHFYGGLDSETPAWQVKSGLLKDCLNWEIGVNGGYARIEGYERFDGRPKPSAGRYYILNVTITGSF
jgi:hypothetical protein